MRAILCMVGVSIFTSNAAVAQEKEEMTEYNFRLCMMLSERLNETENKKLSNFSSERKFAVEKNKIIMIMIDEEGKIEPARLEALRKDFDYAGRMQKDHKRKMDLYTELFPVYEADYQKTCYDKQASQALIKQHCSGMSFLLGDFCKAQIKASAP